MKKTSKTTAKKPVGTKKTAVVKKAPAKKVSEKKPAAAKKAPVAKKVAEKKTAGASKSLVTVISVNLDVGFGNMLTIRGEGPGLSWNSGVMLDCVADDRWSITLPGVTAPVTYKVLINDTLWSAGPDYVAQPGSDNVVEPTF